MKAWLYGLVVLFSLVLLIGCEGAGAGGGDDGTGDGTGDGTAEPLPGEEINLTGTVTTEINPNTFAEKGFTNGSEAVIFFLVDSGFTFSVYDQDTPATRNYDFDLTIPVPEADDLQDIPTGVTSSDPDAKIINIDLYGAREDGIVYDAADVLAFGSISGTGGPGGTRTAELRRYVYADRETTLDGTDQQTGIVIDNLSLEAGWNEVLQTTVGSFDTDGVSIIDVTNTLSNGSVPSGSEWLLITSFLRGKVESTNDSENEAVYLAYDSDNPTQSEVFLRSRVFDGDMDLTIDGEPVAAGRKVLIYFGLDDPDNGDGNLDDGLGEGQQYSFGGETDGTDMLDVFLLVYSETSTEQITAGTGPADNTTQIDGTPLGNYMEIVEASLLYENWGPSDGESYQWELTDTEGSVIQGSLQISGVPGTQAFDYADYPF